MKRLQVLPSGQGYLVSYRIPIISVVFKCENSIQSRILLHSLIIYARNRRQMYHLHRTFTSVSINSSGIYRRILPDHWLLYYQMNYEGLPNLWLLLHTRKDSINIFIRYEKIINILKKIFLTDFDRYQQ